MAGGVGHLESERGTVSTRRSVRPYVAAVAMAVAGVVLVLGSLVVTALAGQRWWWEPEVAVPRDGAADRVSVDGSNELHAIWSDRSLLIDPVCALTGSDDAPVEVAQVPPSERVSLDEPWVAEPEASWAFTAPADGVVVATCDDVDSTPVSTLHLAPMHPRLYCDAMQYGAPLLGLLLGCGGVAVAVVTAIRRRLHRA